MRGLAPGVAILPVRASERVETTGGAVGAGDVADLLDGDVASQAFVLAEPDGAHAAPADFSDHAVASGDGPLRHLTSFHCGALTQLTTRHAGDAALPEN